MIEKLNSGRENFSFNFLPQTCLNKTNCKLTAGVQVEIELGELL